MSVSRLLRLLETGEYQRCLDEATALLDADGHDAENVARIEAARCRSFLALTDYHAAAKAGRRAADLAREAGATDLLGAVLVDLGTALDETRRFDMADAALREYLAGLSGYTSASCMEGIALQRLAGVKRSVGHPQDAVELLEQARRWHRRFGDEVSAREAARDMLAIYLECDDADAALRLLAEDGGTADCAGLLDWATFFLAVGRHSESTHAAFAALDSAGDDRALQCRAQLLLARNALARDRQTEALEFVLAARVLAIDGRLYTLEFEASDILFRLLGDGGASLLREVEADFDQQGVNVYHYLSDTVIRRQYS